MSKSVRTAYSRHVLRAQREGFTPLSLKQFTAKAQPLIFGKEAA